MSGGHRVIVYADASDYSLVGRVVRHVTDPAYQWPSDGIAMLSFSNLDGSTVQSFGVRRNKRSITIYAQSHPAAPVSA